MPSLSHPLRHPPKKLVGQGGQGEGGGEGKEEEVEEPNGTAAWVRKQQQQQPQEGEERRLPSLLASKRWKNNFRHKEEEAAEWEGGWLREE